LSERGPQDQESIGELFSRLVEDGRGLITNELALFRVDFYRRISRAKLGVALCVGGAIMAQAAAVVLLISIAFALGPIIGPFPGAAVAALIGFAAAGIAIRFGLRRLSLIIDDDAQRDDKNSEEKRRTALLSVDELFARARARSQVARARLAETVGEAQQRLSPQTLMADLLDDALDQGQKIAHRAVNALRFRPFRTFAAIALSAALLFRGPLAKAALRAAGKTGATGSQGKSYPTQGARTRALPRTDEEKTS
jgi:hypothetical protein